MMTLSNIARQKALEERIRTPFSFSSPAESARKESRVRTRWEWCSPVLRTVLCAE